jgi:glycerate 2-kinase
MTSQEAKQLTRRAFLETLPHLEVAAKMHQIVRLHKGMLEVGGERFALNPRRPTRLISIGKAAIQMAHALANTMQGTSLHGVVAAAEEPSVRLPELEYYKGGHPFPNEQSWQAAEAALALLDQRHASAEDLVVFLISGGGSAMLEKPVHPAVTLEQLAEFYRLLVRCGATIGQINTLRKHFSKVKAGRLAQAAWPARQLTLYVSDVPDHLPSMIASGPTMPDDTTMADCNELLNSRGLQQSMQSFRASFSFAAEHCEPTPKPGDRWFEHSCYHCMLSNRDAIEQLAAQLRIAGVVVEINSRCDDWHFQKAADFLLSELSVLQTKHPGRAVAVVSGGELSCPVLGKGIGGRNQGFVLHCATKIEGSNVVVLSAGTDGIDGNSPAAGAVADGETMKRAKKLGLSADFYQRHSDSFTFFERLGDTIITGPTGTNVRDLRLLLAY